VGSLYFWDFANRPSSSSSGPRSPLSLPRARDPPPLAASQACCRPAPPSSCPTCRLAASPTARAASAGLPSSCHVGPPVPSGRHAHPKGMSAPLVDLSPALCLLSLSLSFYRAVLSYKLNPNPISPPDFHFLLLATTEPTTELLAGFLRGCSTLPKSQPSSAPSPPPLAPRPALVELPAFPSRNCLDPMTRRSCRARPSSLVTSPPVGTCRSRSVGHRQELAGAHM
jgi:hypothetical protein